MHSSAANCGVRLPASKFDEAMSLRRSLRLLVCARLRLSMMLKHMGNYKVLMLVWVVLLCHALGAAWMVLLDAKRVWPVYWQSCRAVRGPITVTVAEVELMVTQLACMCAGQLRHVERPCSEIGHCHTI